MLGSAGLGQRFETIDRTSVSASGRACWPLLRLRSCLAPLIAAVVAWFVLCAWSEAFASAEGASANSSHLLPPSDSPSIPELIERPGSPRGFNSYDGGWIKFAYPPEARRKIQPLIEQANSVRADLIMRLGQPLLRDVVVHIARTSGEMTTLAPRGAPYPKYADGVAYSSIGLVLLTLEAQNPNARHDLGEVFRHELAHVAIYDALEGQPVPRWFNEGFAVFASGESSYPRLQTLWTATLAETLIPLKELERGFPRDAQTASVAYAEAADVVRFLVRSQERHRFERLIDLMRQERTFDAALKIAYGLDVPELEFEWKQDAGRRYTFWPVFFSGGFIWVGAVVLFIWGWKRRRRRDLVTLERWDHEEATNRERQRQLQAESEPHRIHIVLPRSSQRYRPGMPVPRREIEVPKVEHDGRWHTLH